MTGVGGVHRGGESSMDISADLVELGKTPMAGVYIIQHSVKLIECALHHQPMHVANLTQRPAPLTSEVLVSCLLQNNKWSLLTACCLQSYLSIHDTRETFLDSMQSLQETAIQGVLKLLTG